MEQKKNQLTVKAKMPVGEMFGFTDELRSETEGRGRWFLKDSEFEKLPANLQEEVISKIRDRKGLEPLDDKVFDVLG